MANGTAPGAEAKAAPALAVLRALGEPNRLRLFEALREKERCVTDLVDSMGLPQPLVSHHLRVLAEAGLVQTRRSDGFTFYALDPAGLAAALAAATALFDPQTVGPLAQPGGNLDCCR